MTGANTMPLANRRTFGNEEARASPAPPPPPPAADQSVQVYGTAASRAGRFDAAAYSNSIKKMYEAGMGSAPRESREGRPRKRRWGDASSKVNIPGLPTTLPNGMSSEQLDMYQSGWLRAHRVFPWDHSDGFAFVVRSTDLYYS